MNFCALLDQKDEKYAEYLLSQDHLYKKIPETQRWDLLNKAIACGRETASEFTSTDLWAFCQQESIEIEYFEEEIKAENFRFVLAEFQLPNRIRINQSLLREAETFLAEQEFLKDRRVEEILLAHELYHYLENQQESYTTQKQLTYQTGPFKRQARVHSLSEIAATSFAKELLDLNFSPILLNALLLYPVAPDYSQELAKQLLMID
ncbi:hypothetical protein [Enterococcus sp. DIV0170]|uniref:hypothetical protein n=1 Tax=Enterococcus sp. DIV0170 TaxID=2774642 RepID=UPI003F2696E9